MEMVGSSIAPTPDLKFMLASNVNVSNFVSVKLSNCSNYKIWKAQILCLIKSQTLLHIINDEDYPFPEDKGLHMIVQYDELVKGWIFGSLNENVLKDFVDLGTAREVWAKLESIFNQPISDTEDGDSSQALDVSSRTQDLKFMLASNVNVSNFVSVKLSNRSHYKIWKAQMFGLIQSQGLLHIINKEDYPFPEDKGVHMIPQYDGLIKGWILGSLSEKVLKELLKESFNSTDEVLTQLGSIIYEIDTKEGFPLNATEDVKYMQASNINVSCFVSVKLSGHNNYHIWKAQMLCLLQSQLLLHIVDKDEYSFPEDKGDQMLCLYDELVKGWIFGSMSEKMLKDSVQFQSARKVWMELESTYNLPITKGVTSPGFKFRTEFVRVPETEDTANSILKKELYDAAVEGCWWKAKSILKIKQNAATEAINENSDTILHVAVEMGHNFFVEKLLEFLKDGKDIEMKNGKGRTALHIAAMVDNTQAAQLLVQKRKQLLEIQDRNEESALDISYTNSKLDISAYLLKFALPFDSGTYSEDYQENAIFAAIFTKQYDLAETLVKKFHELVRKNHNVLMAITLTFPTGLGLAESLIYPSFHNVRQKTTVRGSLLFHPIFLDKCVDDILRVVKICNNMCWSWLQKFSIILLVLIGTIYPIYQLICVLILVLRLPFSMLYFLLWKVLAIIVHPIKNIEKKKKEYKDAKKILSLICDQMGTSSNGYSDSIIEAVRQGAYEVVDEILYWAPETINCKDEEGHNVIQLAIMNRSEKVYNLIYHIIERSVSYRTMTDSSKNNLVHLAGRLAPSFVLNRTTGAALQLQRELIWNEEVKKLMSPIELIEENMYEETPAMVFTQQHRDLMKQGENWMKTTAESCSITAALIVTVVFAAAITVPGGNNQESGIPLLKKQIAFTIFAVSNAFSLFTSATALLLFLSILTARFSEKDFLVSLPRRLIFGLLTLFLSTTAMIVAFGGILFLVFCDQRPWMLAPIFGFACLPISVIVTIKLPLLVDLIQSTYIPIFGKQSYLESCKISRKNTLFTE